MSSTFKCAHCGNDKEFHRIDRDEYETKVDLDAHGTVLQSHPFEWNATLEKGDIIYCSRCDLAAAGDFDGEADDAE